MTMLIYKLEDGCGQNNGDWINQHMYELAHFLKVKLKSCTKKSAQKPDPTQPN